MAASIWTVRDGVAQANFEPFAARVEIARPHLGLLGVRPGIGDATHPVLQFHFAGTPEGPEPISDCYVRGNDLVARYQQTSERPFETQLYWRILADQIGECVYGAVEVIASAQTSLLDSHPAVMSHTRIAAKEILWLRGDAATDFEDVAADRPAVARPKGGKGCFVFRPTDGQFSYIEMVHPVDFDESKISRDSEEIAIEHQLISRWMEKGVIVRARLRALIVDRTKDKEIAVSAYQSFAKDEIPLTT